MAIPAGLSPIGNVPSTASLGLNFITLLLPPDVIHTLPEASMAIPQ
jgi:hypothetical protein